MSDLAAGINFDGLAANFADYDATLRGYVRYQVTRRNLEPFLSDDQPLSILDIGGGNGPDASWFAVHGHQVTMIEDSADQIAFAKRRFNYFLNEAERKRITVVPGTIANLRPKRSTFDVVVVHGVAMYQPAPLQFIADALRYVKVGGIVSLLEKGYFGAEARAVREQMYDDLKLLHEQQRVTNHVERLSYAFKPAELKHLLQANAFHVEHWSGVRVITDDMYLRMPDIDATMAKAIVDAEYSQGKNPAIRGQGQLLHFIARKN